MGQSFASGAFVGLDGDFGSAGAGQDAHGQNHNKQQKHKVECAAEAWLNHLSAPSHPESKAKAAQSPLAESKSTRRY